MIGFKPEVVHEGIDFHVWYAIGVVNALMQEFFQKSLVVTSMKDGRHKVGSKHYDGLAFDMRTTHGNLLAPHEIAYLYHELRKRLDLLGFDTVIENDHLHIEWDPKYGEMFYKIV